VSEKTINLLSDRLRVKTSFMTNITITVINVLLVESAVFTLCFINNSRRILSFIVFLLSAYAMVAYLGAEFFGILMLMLFLPIVFVMFMLGNMVRIRKEKYIETKTAIVAGLTSGITTLTVSFLFPYDDKKNISESIMSASDFLSGLYRDQMHLIVIAAILTFITALVSVVVFYDEKRQDSR